MNDIRHNHITRDIKPEGQCPSCDDYHNRNKPGETLLTSLDQLKVGTFIRLVAKCDKYSHKSISVKKLIKMKTQHGDGSVYGKDDTEVLTNRSKNHYFSLNAYLAGESQWVKEVYVLDKPRDKRLKAVKKELA